METHLLVVPYDTARRDWRSGAGPNRLVQAGLTTHLHSNGHFVADIQVIEDDSAHYSRHAHRTRRSHAATASDQ
jgi:hypothetical protein